MASRRTFAAALARAALAAAAGVALTWVPARAQTVEVFGIIDLAVERVDHVGAARGTVTRLPSLTGELPSRLGFRGSEDLGDGLRAVFVAEMGFAPDVGTPVQGGRSFGRQALVGLAGPWGSLTLGRQYTMLFWSLLEADVLGPNLYGTGSLDAYIPNARADNAIVYRGAAGPFSFGTSFSFGRDTVNAGSAAGTNCAGEGNGGAQACREWSWLVKVDRPTWGAALAQDVIRGGPGALFGMTRAQLKDRRLSANGYLKVGTWRLAAGVVRRSNDATPATRRSDLGYVGVIVPLTPLLVFDAEALRLSFSQGSDRATLVAGRLTYSLSKRTAIYAMAGHIANDGTLAMSVSGGAGGSAPAPGGAQSALAAGMRVSF